MTDSGFVRFITRFQAFVCMLWLSKQAMMIWMAGYILYFEQPRAYSDAVYALAAAMVGVTFALLVWLVMFWCRVTVVSIQVAAWTWPNRPGFRIFKHAIKTKSFGGQRIFARALDLPHAQLLAAAFVASAMFCFIPQTRSVMSTIFWWTEVVMFVTMLCILVRTVAAPRVSES